MLLRAVAKRRWRRGFLPREPSTSQFPRWVVAVLWLYLQGALRQWSSLVALASRVPAGVAAGWIRLDLGLSIPAPPDAIGSCSASRRVEDVTGVWEKSMVGQQQLVETAATLPVVPILMALSSSPGLVMFWVCYVEFYAW